MLDSDIDGEPPGDGCVLILDSNLETVVTDDQCNTNRVTIDSVDAEEFLDYPLAQGKITIEQRDSYGEHHEFDDRAQGGGRYIPVGGDGRLPERGGGPRGLELHMGSASARLISNDSGARVVHHR